MNDVLETLLLVAILSLAALWVTAVFCFVLYTLGVYDD
jgi:hypothetical protein